MKKYARILILLILIGGNILICKSQCTIVAGKTQTIICGGSVQLNALAVIKRVNNDTVHYFTSVFFYGKDTGYAVGYLNEYYYNSNNGMVLKTTNGGDSWVLLTDTVYGNLNAVYFTDANTGYIVGPQGRIFKSTDGGTIWNNIRFGPWDQNNYNSILFTSRDTGFIGGSNGQILKTTNAGINWNERHYDTIMSINSICFPDKNTGYAAGYNPNQGLSYFLKSSDAGKTWIQSLDTLKYELHSVYFIDANTGYITGSGSFPPSYTVTSEILKTTDGGTNWKVVKTVSGITLNSVRFQDAKNGYAVGSKGTILKTSDGGTSWEAIATNTSNSFASIGFSSGNKTAILGSQTGIDMISIPDSYSWSPSAGMNDTTLAAPIVSPLKTTTYILHATYNPGCVAVDSVKVIVNPLLVTANDVVASCGNTANLSASTNYTGSGTLRYAWSPAANLSDSTLSNPVLTTNEPSVYSVSVTTPNGCKVSTDVNVSMSAVTIQPSICMVTVGDNNKNVVVWQKPVSTSIDSFLIYRESVNQTGVYDLIGKLPYTAQSVFIDTASNALVQSNKYKIAIKDICDLKTAQSPAHKTMHLNINQGQGSNWNLIWEEYEGFAVSSYKIYRGASISDLQLIGSTAGGNSSYSDFAAPAGDVFYQVEVIPPADCSHVKSTSYTSSRSNIAINTAMSVSGQLSNTPGFKAYPVPANDILYFNLLFSQNARASITSIDGKFIMNCGLNSTQNSIHLSSLQKGMYIIRITDNSNTYVTRFIKE